MESEIIHGLALEKSIELENNSINCIITSPPYWQLRDYGFSEQWGLEPTYNEYLEHLWSLFDVLKDKLTEDGTVWVNLGDSYNSHTAYAKTCGGITKKRLENDPSAVSTIPQRQSQKHAPDKCLLLIPHRFAIGMIDRGWILRNDIIWAKPNGMPESVTDRFSKKHEFIFLFVKSKKYYFDLEGIKNPLKGASLERMQYCYGHKTEKQIEGRKQDGRPIGFKDHLKGANPGDVSDFWAITTKPNSTNHYASYNSQLIDKPIIAGCPKGGTILDPFAGTGTTLVRAMQLERKGIGIEGNPEYAKIAEKNIEPYLIQNNLFKVA